jgi:hypothetical protein
MFRHPPQHRAFCSLAPQQSQIRIALGLRPLREVGQGFAAETFDPQAHPSTAALAKIRPQ